MKMAKNYVQDGAVMPVTLGGTKAAGDLVMVEDTAAVLLQGGASSDVVQGQIEGVFTLPKATPLVVAQGAILYWNGTALTNTSNSGANKRVGIAFSGGLSAATTIQCKLNV
jgi:predicted RecA/RadA family phage recombinase